MFLLQLNIFLVLIYVGSGQLSSYSLTLVSGFLAVISVNMVIATYVYIAMKEQNSDKQKPDPKVLAEAKAKASASQFQSNETKENSSSTRFKRE